MNEMIERAVKRLQEAFSSSAYGLPHLDPHTGEMLVRVVVEAMREPSDQMRHAGAEMLPDTETELWSAVALVKAANDATKVYQAMIDEILKDAEP